MNTTLTEPNVPLPRWKSIYDQLHQELGQFTYGSDFYSITDITRRFRVSKATAIRVLNELASRHLIEKIPGKGNLVRQITQPLAIRMITPAQARRDFLTFDAVAQRLTAGITQAVHESGSNFSTICETVLPSLFPRTDQRFGFLIRRRIPLATIDFLRQHRLPHVFVDVWDDYKNTPHTRIDRVKAGELATGHLLEMGHRRIALIHGLISQPNFRDRLKGYRKALRAAGIAFDWKLIKETTGVDAQQVDEAFEELMELRNPPTAIIVGDDSRGIHLLDGCRRRGIQVPRDLSIVGYPNYAESSLTDPPLTVIDTHYEQVGHAAVRLLLEQILNQADPQTQGICIKPTLVIRASTGPVPAAGARRR